MSAYWVTFTDKPPLCIEGKTETEAMLRTGTPTTVKSIKILPYPAEPRMQPVEKHQIVKWDTATKTYTPSGEPVACPSFCYTPSICAGRTSCPKNYACSE